MGVNENANQGLDKDHIADIDQIGLWYVDLDAK